uniref:Uncharacterized protein n=1 Tax=Arundo donax TaxID=35708 RepID=A0A0A8ZZ27_ARUDO
MGKTALSWAFLHPPLICHYPSPAQKWPPLALRSTKACSRMRTDCSAASQQTLAYLKP